jgi:hypothetical protein
MANLYIQADETLPDHPKTTRAVRLLRVNRCQFLGHLNCLWIWAMKNAPDGNLSRFSVRDISDAARWTDRDDFEDSADTAAEKFVGALVECRTHDEGYGFLERDEDGDLYLHDWQDYGGRVEEKRQRNTFLKWLRRYAERLGKPVADSEENFARWEAKRQPVEADPPFPATPVAPPTPAKAATEPLPSSVPDMSSGHHSDVSPCPPLEKRSEAKRNGEQQSVAERSVEQQQQSVAGGVGGDPKAPVESPPSAAAAAKNANASRENAPEPVYGLDPDLPALGENPRAYVERILAVRLPAWREELAKRWGAQPTGAIRSEWGWKARIVADWVSGKEPPPGSPGAVSGALPAYSDDDLRAQKRYLADVPEVLWPDLEKRARNCYRGTRISYETAAKKMRDLHREDAAREKQRAASPEDVGRLATASLCAASEAKGATPEVLPAIR